MTNVSTVSASAAEEILETPQSLDEAIETGFLPDDEHYRLTGEFEKPGKKDDPASPTGKEKPAAKESDAPPASEQEETDDASKAAASATAQTQRTETRRESRWEKRERELKEARAEIARLKAQPPQTERRSEPTQESQPAPETAAGKTAGKPKLDDIDPKTKQPKYKNYAEYEDAKDAWLRQEAIREFRQESERTAQQQEFAAIDRKRAEEVEKIRATDPNYDKLLTDVLEAKEADGRSPIYYEPGTPIDNFLLSQPDHGVGLLYHCLKNVSDPAIRAIFARVPDGSRYQLKTVEQIGRLAVLAHTLTASTSRTRQSQKQNDSEDELSSARPVTRASRPPHQVSGQGTVAKDAVEQALEDGDSETYIRAQNAKQLAALKRK